MGRMEGNVVIVTGASDGIGAAICRQLASEGARVAMAARRAEPLERLAVEIKAAGGEADWTTVDICDGGALDAFIRDVAARHGVLHGLVNNAAAVGQGTVGDTDDKVWRETFSGGVDAVFVAMRAALDVMRSGSIVNIASAMGRRGTPGMAAYSSSKAAVEALTRTAAVESALSGVRINAVAPGLILTPGTRNFFDQQPGEQIKAERDIPMGRGGLPNEVAQAVVFLLSNDASYITGTCIDVDGGRLARL